MTEQAKQDLLPCPFCGGAGHLGHLSISEDVVFVVCQSCKAQTAFCYSRERSIVEVDMFEDADAKDDAIAAWNRRPEPKPRTNFDKWKAELTVENFIEVVSGGAACKMEKVGKINCRELTSTSCRECVMKWANAEAGE